MTRIVCVLRCSIIELAPDDVSGPDKINKTRIRINDLKIQDLSKSPERDFSKGVLA